MGKATATLTRNQLREHLSRKAGQTPSVVADVISRTGRNMGPLTYGQEQLWAHAAGAASQATYNECVLLQHVGTIETPILRQAFNDVVRRYEAWRTIFPVVHGRPMQQVQAARWIDIPEIDLGGLGPEEQQKRAKAIIDSEASRPFDLVVGPLFRTKLVWFSPHRQVLVLTLHQIIFDGVSLYEVFFPELRDAYRTRAEGHVPCLQDFRCTMVDYAIWQRQTLTEQVADADAEFWRRELEGAADFLDLPTDYVRPSVQTSRGDQICVHLGPELVAPILRVCSERGVSLYMFFAAALQMLLFRYTGQNDFLLGTVTAARPSPEVERVVGAFVRPGVLRAQIEEDLTFAALLAQIRERVLTLLSRSNVPLARLTSRLGLKRDPSYNPLYQTLFVWEPAALPREGEWTLDHLSADTHACRADLHVQFAETENGGLEGRFKYNADLFNRGTIELMLERYVAVLRSAAADPTQKVSAIALPRTEVPRFIPVPSRPHPLQLSARDIDQTIHERFDRVAQAAGDKVAVCDPGSQWTYAELEHRANAIAAAVLRLIGPSATVAVMFQKGFAAFAGILGVLKAGGTYIPVDLSHPAERIRWILQDSGARLVLTDNDSFDCAAELVDDSLRVVNISNLSHSEVFVEAYGSPEQPAYVLYTSGSTGKPKGVVQTHRGLLHHMAAYTEALQINADDRLSMISSHSLDAGTVDLFSALLNGATLCPVQLADGGMSELLRCTVERNITIYHSTPTIFRYFMKLLGPNEVVPGVRLLILGGEECARSDFENYKRHFDAGCLFVNGLGPTEADVALLYVANKSTALNRPSVPVGNPVSRTEVFLLSESGMSGQIFGEVAIRSPFVALGYLNRPDETSAVFIEQDSTRMYKTGDLGKLTPSGAIEFAGRRDSQVKIRGFRVELGEIETVIRNAGAEQAAVTVRPDGHGGLLLLAYYTGANLTDQKLRQYAATNLPDYMVPDDFIRLDNMPLTPSGKILRRLLPEPATRQVVRAEPTLPRDALEQGLLEIWREVLQLPDLTMDDDFFDCGGDSIRAAFLVAAVARRFHFAVPLASLLRAPTVARLASLLRDNDEGADWSCVVAVQPGGVRPPLFCVHALGGNVLSYRLLSKHLGPEQPFYALQSQWLRGAAPHQVTVEEMASQYVRSMRAVQPHGPYLLGGQSLGGIIAYEMAQQLLRTGEEVALLAWLDTYPSTRLRGRRRFIRHLRQLAALDFAGIRRYVWNRLRFRFGYALWKIRKRLYRKNAVSSARDPLPAFANLQWLNRLAVSKYELEPYPGKLTVFRAEGSLVTADDDREFTNMVGAMQIHAVPGDHETFIREPHVATLADKVSSCLEAATASTVASEAAA